MKTKWQKITKQKPTAAQLRNGVMAGSFRQEGKRMIWGVSSVWNYRGWDADRTHYVALPKFPTA